MRIIERNAHGTEFAVWLDEEEKNLIEAYKELKRMSKKDSDILLINPETYFGYNIETGKAVALEFTELDSDGYTKRLLK